VHFAIRILNDLAIVVWRRVANGLFLFLAVEINIEKKIFYITFFHQGENNEKN
jgi:hypothetical protein